MLALFVFSIDLSALHFDYKVFNITIKRNNTECQHSGAQRLAVLTESTASPTLTCLCDTILFSNKTLPCAINKTDSHRNTGGKGNTRFLFAVLLSPSGWGTIPCELCQDRRGKGAVQDQGTDRTVGCGHPESSSGTKYFKTLHHNSRLGHLGIVFIQIMNTHNTSVNFKKMYCYSPKRKLIIHM